MSERKSVSNIVEKHASQVVKKFEAHIPLHIKSFSDFFREYMKSFEEIHRINCIVESRIFAEFSLDEKSINMLDDYIKLNSQFYMFYIESYAEFLKEHLKVRQSMMESYNKTLKYFSTNLKYGLNPTSVN